MANRSGSEVSPSAPRDAILSKCQIEFFSLQYDDIKMAEVTDGATCRPHLHSIKLS